MMFALERYGYDEDYGILMPVGMNLVSESIDALKERAVSDYKDKPLIWTETDFGFVTVHLVRGEFYTITRVEVLRSTPPERRLVAQGEAEKPDSLGFYHGIEIFQVGFEFELVIHTRRYEGIKPTSHHATPPVRLKATTLDEARAEARKEMSAYVVSVTGGYGGSGE